MVRFCAAPKSPFTQGRLSETGNYCKNPTYDRNHRSDLTVLRTPAETDGIFSVYQHPAASLDTLNARFNSSTKAVFLAVSSTQAGTNPHLIAFRTDFTFDHAAQ